MTTRYILTSPTGKRLVCSRYTDAARIQRRLAERGTKTQLVKKVRG